jgi:hypothetical protein
MRFANDAAEIESGRASSAFIRTLSLAAPASEIEHFIPNSIPNPISQTNRTQPAIALQRLADARLGRGIVSQISGAQGWGRTNGVLNRCSALDFDRTGDANRGEKD